MCGYYILGHQEESFSTLSQTFRELSGGGGAGHHMMEDSLPSSPNSSLEEGKYRPIHEPGPSKKIKVASHELHTWKLFFHT